MCENYGVRLPGAEVAWRMCTKYHQITSGRCVCVCVFACVCEHQSSVTCSVEQSYFQKQLQLQYCIAP